MEVNVYNIKGEDTGSHRYLLVVDAYSVRNREITTSN